MKKIFIQENLLHRLTLNPGLALTGFRTNGPRIWGKKERKYANILAKIRVTPSLQIQRDFYGDAMLVPVCMVTNMATRNQQKYLSLSFATKA